MAVGGDRAGLVAGAAVVAPQSVVQEGQPKPVAAPTVAAAAAKKGGK